METSTVLHNEEIIANKKKFSAQTVAICTMAVVIAVMAIMLLVLLTDTKTDDESSISSLLDAPLFDDNGLLAAQSDGRWGFINDKGEWVVNPQFAWVGEFTEQGLCVVRNEEQYGYIGLDGKYIINPIFLDAESFSGNNLAAAQDKETEKWGYINESGEFVISPQFDSAYSFDKEGRAVVEVNEKYGVIGVDGKYIINPQFETDFHFDKPHGTAVVGSGKEYGIIDSQGSYILNPTFLKLSGCYADGYRICISETDKKVRLTDENGEELVSAGFDAFEWYYSISEDDDKEICKKADCTEEIYKNGYCFTHWLLS